MSGHAALTFWNDGATRSFITNKFAKRVGPIVRAVTFIVETMGGKMSEERGMLYEFDLTGLDGYRHKIWAFGIEMITSIPEIDFSTVEKMFPEAPPSAFD